MPKVARMSFFSKGPVNFPNIISDHFVNEITTILDEVVIVKDKKIASHLSADDIRAHGKSIEEYYESLYADEGAE